MSEMDLRLLLGMLDDPDEKSAVKVMGELLKYEDDLLPLLGELQEAEDTLLRKRIQQLEAIVRLRKRRRHFLELLESDQLDIIEGLVELHLLWFDRDDPEMLMEMLESFMQIAANNEIKSIGELGAFMARNHFTVPAEEEASDPENFCIGPVLEDRLGSDILLCTLALLAGLDVGLQLGLVRVGGHFAVVNAAGEMISPENDWLVDRHNRLHGGDFWNDPRSVLKYASLMLFLYAVRSDNFRYVHTIGHALCGSDELDMLKDLPYPYNGQVADR